MQRAVQFSSVQTVVASRMGRSSCFIVLLRLLPVFVHFVVALFVNLIFSSLAPRDDRFRLATFFRLFLCFIVTCFL